MNKNFWIAFNTFENHSVVLEVSEMTHHCYSLGFSQEYHYYSNPKVSWLSLILLESIQNDPSPLQLNTNFQIRLVPPFAKPRPNRIVLPLPLLSTEALIDCLGEELVNREQTF